MKTYNSVTRLYLNSLDVVRPADAGGRWIPINHSSLVSEVEAWLHAHGIHTLLRRIELSDDRMECVVHWNCTSPSGKRPYFNIYLTSSYTTRSTPYLYLGTTIKAPFVGDPDYAHVVPFRRSLGRRRQGKFDVKSRVGAALAMLQGQLLPHLEAESRLDVLMTSSYYASAMMALAREGYVAWSALRQYDKALNCFNNNPRQALTLTKLYVAVAASWPLHRIADNYALTQRVARMAAEGGLSA